MNDLLALDNRNIKAVDEDAIKNKDRYLFTCEVYDNVTKTSIVNEGFNCSHIIGIIVKLNEILAKLSNAKMPTR